MIDWKKEVNKVNICGWCVGGRDTCNGNCFETASDNIAANNFEKILHLKRELKVVKKRKKALKEELEKLTGGKDI